MFRINSRVRGFLWWIIYSPPELGGEGPDNVRAEGGKEKSLFDRCVGIAHFFPGREEERLLQ
ncbi:MAG: hypothetical protein J7K85_09105 [Anaerolineaceae bacterium]|nr:hypothetical protein [Anaerolineaceae bacterium]